MVWTIGEDLDSFDSLVPIARSPSTILMMMHESGANESLAYIRNALVAKVVGQI
jgi:hypothetical protein